MVLDSQRGRSSGLSGGKFSSRRSMGRWAGVGVTVLVLAGIYGLSLWAEHQGRQALSSGRSPTSAGATEAQASENPGDTNKPAGSVALASPDQTGRKVESSITTPPAAAPPAVPPAPAAVPIAVPTETVPVAVESTPLTVALASPGPGSSVAAPISQPVALITLTAAIAPASTAPSPAAAMPNVMPVVVAQIDAPPVPVTTVAVPTTAPATTAPATKLTVTDQARQGILLVEQGHLLDGRTLLNDLLLNHAYELTAADAQLVRDAMAKANQNLIFSNNVMSGDPLVERYVVQNNDVLSKVAPRYHIPYQLIEQINNVKAPSIRVDQKLKVVKGPFHVVVHKAAFRLDLFLNDSAGKPFYVRSFPIGLGEGNSTPEGNWVVASGGKVTKPSWTNPRTGQYFAPEDPKNPLGGYWIRIEGADDKTRGLQGYGLHGTIEPDSIGKQMSMGCIRMLPNDIALLFKLLVGQASTVRIEP